MSEAAFDIFLIVLSLGLLFALVASGVRLGVGTRTAAGAIGFVLAAIIVTLIARATVRG